tara:strand:+ start:1967 stop:3367 length:1401 start_codon:yes stop_codon:yes gene_type:complete
MIDKFINYKSTRGSSPILKFNEVIFEGLAADGGLYVPEKWPVLTNEQITSFKDKSYNEIAHEVISVFLDDSISSQDLAKIINDSYSTFTNSEITPLRKLDQNQYLLELFHGPTFAFKDLAMQFIGNIMNLYLSRHKRQINILGATSGDTGAAAIEGFKNVDNVNIFILHPHNKISKVQKKFMTTVVSENVYNIAIKGTFDDCQNIIKTAFSDLEFKKNNNLTAINSINWARIMCQTVYYFYAMSRLDATDKSVMFSVPTGNFGDILAGYISLKMGLKISKLNIATNENDILTRTINTGIHDLRDVKPTSSPSIDIQVSSNFERLLFDMTNSAEFVKEQMSNLKSNRKYELSKEIVEKMQNVFSSHSVSQQEVKEIIQNYFKDYNVIIDPHTAVGLGSANKCEEGFDIKVTLATAHPAKFNDTVSEIVGSDDFIPLKVRDMMERDDNYVILDNDVMMVKKFLEDKIK